MSLYTGLEETIRLLRVRIEKQTKMITENGDNATHWHLKCDENGKLADELYDRIHLDLNPRIKRKTETIRSQREAHEAHVKRLNAALNSYAEQHRLDQEEIAALNGRLTTIRHIA